MFAVCSAQVFVDTCQLQCRRRHEVSGCKCIAALSACLDALPEGDIQFPWLANKKDNDAGAKENYLTWTNECGKTAQVSQSRYVNDA